MDIRVDALGQPPADVDAMASPSGARGTQTRGISEERSQTIISFGRSRQSAEHDIRREFLEEVWNRSPWGLLQGGEVCLPIGT